MICGLCGSVKMCPSPGFRSCRSHEFPTMWDFSVEASEPDPSEHVKRWGLCWFVLVSFPVGEDEDEFENFLLPLRVWLKVSLRYSAAVLNKKKQRQVYFYYRGRSNVWEELGVGQAFSSSLAPLHTCASVCGCLFLNTSVLLGVQTAEVQRLWILSWINFVQRFSKALGFLQYFADQGTPFKAHSFIIKETDFSSAIAYLFHIPLFHASIFFVYINIFIWGYEETYNTLDKTLLV